MFEFGILGTIIVYLIPVFLGIMNTRYKSNFLRIGILVYCALITSLAWQVGADFDRYLDIIDNKTTYKFTIIEPLTELVYYFAHFFGEPRIFWFFLGVTSYGSLYLYTERLQEDERDLSIILFFLFFGIIGISLRQMTSIAVSLLAIQAYYNKQHMQATGFFLLAWSIHKTTIVAPFVVLFALILRRLSKYSLLLTPTILIGLITFLQAQIQIILNPIPMIGNYWDSLRVYEAGIVISPFSIIITAVFGAILYLSCDDYRECLSQEYYDYYLTGLTAMSVIIGYGVENAVHIARVLLLFTAVGLPVYSRFIKIPNKAGINAIIYSITFYFSIIIDYDYYPYNISKSIAWTSEDHLSLKLPGANISSIESKIDFIKSVGYPVIGIIVVLMTIGLLFQDTLSKLKKENMSVNIWESDNYEEKIQIFEN